MHACVHVQRSQKGNLKQHNYTTPRESRQLTAGASVSSSHRCTESLIRTPAAGVKRHAHRMTPCALYTNLNAKISLINV